MGTPAPQGSKRGFARNGRVQMVESSKKVGPWREAVVAECQRAGLAGAMLADPVAVAVAFYLPRPKGHHGTGRNASTVKPTAPTRPGGKPDLDKLVRSTLDALAQAGVFADDALVVTVNAEKRWCDEASPVPGAWVQVRSAASDLRLAFDGMPAGTARARPDDWADPAPRVLPDDLDGWRCACGRADLPDVTHSATVCAGRETLGDNA